MRYLDREPRTGDRVRVEFEGVLTYGTDCVTLDNGWEVELGNGIGEPSMTRVIAPEPAVGDEWTPDIQLPAGSIIESGSETARCNPTGSWGSALVDAAQLVRFDSGPWRIVRIGGAP